MLQYKLCNIKMVNWNRTTVYFPRFWTRVPQHTDF